MRLNVIKTVFLKELRELLRDRRSLLVMFGLPLVLYPCLTLLIANLGVTRRTELTTQTAQVVLANAEAAPILAELIQEPDSGLKLAQADDPTAALRKGKIQAIIRVPDNFERALLDQQNRPPATLPRPPTRPAAATATAPASQPAMALEIVLDKSQSVAPYVESKFARVFDLYEQRIIQQRLASYGVPPDVVDPLEFTTTDVATAEQRMGKLLSLMLPMLLLVMGMLGALFPALNATTTERELGTLETLLVTPARRFELLFAKGILVLLCGLLTAAMNMGSMSLVLWRTFSLLGSAGGVTLSPSALVLAYIAAVPAIIFFTAVVMVVGLMARNFREANSFATPVMLLPMASIFIAMMEPAMTTGILLTPVASTTVIIREVLLGHAAAQPFLLSFGASLFYAALMLSVAVRMFSNEQLVNPAWEPISLRSPFKRSSRPRRLPTIDGALALTAITILLPLYFIDVLQKLNVIGAAFVVQGVIIAGTTLLFAVIARYKWQETFLLYRPHVGQLIAAVFIAVGVVPLVYTLQTLQASFWPGNPEVTRFNAQYLFPALYHHPVLTILVVASLAGITEELLYRGPLQNAFVRRLPPFVAIAIVALIFGIAHMDVHGMPIRTLLGFLLGWMAWRGKSLFPAILAHALYDAIALSWSAFYVHNVGLDKALDDAGKTAGSLPLPLPAFAAIGLIIFVLALSLYRRASPKPTKP